MVQQAKSVGPALKDLRISKGLRQKDVARDCDMTASQLANIEKGTRDVRVSTLLRLLKVLDAQITDIWPKAP